MIMFLLQNYRYGAVAVNSLLIHVGFCIYKVRVEIVFPSPAKAYWLS